MPETSANEVVQVVSLDDARTIVDESLEGAVDELNAQAQGIADSAAAAAVDASRGEVGEMMESLASPVVTLDAEQWDYIQTSVRGAGGAALFGLLLAALMLGAILAQILTGRWRR